MRAAAAEATSSPRSKIRISTASEIVRHGRSASRFREGQVDSADGRLLVQHWTWIDGAESGALKQRIEDELGGFERFQLDS